MSSPPDPALRRMHLHPKEILAPQGGACTHTACITPRCARNTVVCVSSPAEARNICAANENLHRERGISPRVVWRTNGALHSVASRRDALCDLFEGVFQVANSRHAVLALVLLAVGEGHALERFRCTDAKADSVRLELVWMPLGNPAKLSRRGTCVYSGTIRHEDDHSCVTLRWARYVVDQAMRFLNGWVETRTAPSRRESRRSPLDGNHLMCDTSFCTELHNGRVHRGTRIGNGLRPEGIKRCDELLPWRTAHGTALIQTKDYVDAIRTDS
mmetsp:Transcript_34608/g.91050  ORF Transcript_34608/g.91050 Transcript_34608/m.91050 type:complete len:272 (+) Transcript_34608:425-1240(+)